MRLDKHTPSHDSWIQYVAHEGTKRMSLIDQREMNNYISNVTREYNDFHNSFSTHSYCDDHIYSGSSDDGNFDYEHPSAPSSKAESPKKAESARVLPGQEPHLEGVVEDRSSSIAAPAVRRRVGGPAGMFLGALSGATLAALVPGATGDIAALASMGAGLVYAHPGWVKVLQKRADRKALQALSKSAPVVVESANQPALPLSTQQVPLPLQAQQVLDSIQNMAQYVLGKLEHLPSAQARLEAQALVQTHLPELLGLYQDSIAAVQTAGARQACEDDLDRQLHLVQAELEFLRGQIESEVRRKQQVFGHFLDSKLGRSDLD